MAKKRRQATVKHSRKEETRQPGRRPGPDQSRLRQAEAPSKHDSSPAEVHPRPQQQQVFAQDEGSASPPTRQRRIQSSVTPQPADSVRVNSDTSNVGDQSAVGGLPLVSIRHRRLSIIQNILIGCIAFIAVMLLCALLKSWLRPSIVPAATPIDLQAPAKEQAPVAHPARSEIPVADSAWTVPSQIQEPQAAVAATEGLSLRIAETLYLQNDFKKAYALYSQLRQSLPAGCQEDLLRDFLQLRMASCLEKTSDFDQATNLLRIVSKSLSPVLRAVANYRLSLLEMQKGQYLNARTRAYQTTALVGSLTFDWQWPLSLQRDCHFLAAESLTKHVLSLCDADKNLIPQLWSNTTQPDPLRNLSESELRSVLNSGSEQLSKAVLGPQIQKLQHQGIAPRWKIICSGAPIEELLARFATNAGLDIHWACDSSGPGIGQEKPHPIRAGPERPNNAIRYRPVNLYMPAATIQEFLTVAAGCAGLLARLNDEGTVTIFDPSNYSSLSEHTALLSQEAVSLWQRFLLVCDDGRIPTDGGLDPVQGFALAHFALGLLHAQRGNLTDAIAEYKLVANRYSRTSLAPLALLRSGKLKVELRDYVGAREDLKQLTEQYPDTEFSNQAVLYLAEATMKAGLLQEAARLYCKVHNLGFSLESQRASALAAGRCFYEQQDHENAAKWLTQYINLAPPSAEGGDISTDFYLACLLLGKANLAQGSLQQARNAFESALGGLRGQLLVQEYVETISALVKAYVRQDQFVEALTLLENTRSWHLSQREAIEILLLKAGVLRSMGLADEAIAVLGDRAQYLTDSQLKAKISFELAKCFIAKGDLALARKRLTEILVIVEPGPLAQEAGCELADVCLKLGQNTQVISICLQLMDSIPKPAIKQRALDLLARAYTQQKDYDQAALVLSGKWPGRSPGPDAAAFGGAENTKMKGTPEKPNREDITSRSLIKQDARHDKG